MGAFKRFVSLFYGLCATAAFVALGLTWYGPWSRYVTSLMGTDWFYRAVAAVGLVGIFGSLLIFLSGVFAPRKHTVEVNLPDGSQVCVTQDAISSRVISIVEADGTCIADHVVVRAKKRRGKVGIFVRVCPVSSLDVIEKGEELKSELARGLTSLCGDKLTNINLEFTEPQTEEYHVSLEDSAVSYADDIAGNDPFISLEPSSSSTDYDLIDTELDVESGTSTQANIDMQAIDESE